MDRERPPLLAAVSGVGREQTDLTQQSWLSLGRGLIVGSAELRFS